MQGNRFSYASHQQTIPSASIRVSDLRTTRDCHTDLTIWPFRHSDGIASETAFSARAFQQVEDNLVSLRILSQVINQQDAAVEAATRNLQ